MSGRRLIATRFPLLGALALAGWMAGCGGSPSAPAVTGKLAAAEAQAPAKSPMPAVAPHIPEAGPPLPPISYEGKGRRDPFVPVAPVAEKSAGIDVSAAKLSGVIEGREPLALVETPDGLGYILKPGDVLGNGRVTDIGRGSVTFAIAGRTGQKDANVTLRLVKE